MVLAPRVARTAARIVGATLLFALLSVSTSLAQVPTPDSVLRSELGADSHLAKYDQLLDYPQPGADRDRVQMTTTITTKHPLDDDMQNAVGASFHQDRVFGAVQRDLMSEDRREALELGPPFFGEVVACYAEQDPLMGGGAMGRKSTSMATRR